VSRSVSLYEMLGVAPDASADEIRAAYRRLARVHHPDAGGGGVDMSDLNHAWSVLSDPRRRRDYDLSLSAPVVVAVEPARFPWRFLGVLFLIGLVFVAIGVVTASDPVPPTVDNVLEPGSCVVIDTNGDAVERLCSAPHDGVVTVFLASPGQCPDGTEAHRDHQGMGTACVRLG
jgi:hypothetical protein